MMQANRCLKLLLATLVLLVLFPHCPRASAKEPEASDHFSREEIERATSFNSKLYTLFVFRGVVLLAFLGLVAFSRLRTAYKRDVEKLCSGKRWLVLPIYTFSIVLMIRLVLLPFDAVRDLIIKRSFGLTLQRTGGWLADQVKSFLVGDIWYVPFVVLVYALMRRFKRSWWLISAATVGVMTIAWSSLAPHVVEPLFYRITPVRSKALHQRLDPLLHKAGLEAGVLYEADSGKKTKEVNAYLSGLLLGRRIVLYDVLAEEADAEELEFVVAHEVAHWKKRHVIKGIALGTGGAAAVFLLLGGLLTLTAKRSRRGEVARYGPESLPVFFFWLNVIFVLIMPLECAISRRFERTADKCALELTRNPKGAVTLFQKAAKQNLSDLNPPPLAKLWLHSHPPIVERIEAALKMEGRPDGAMSGTELPATPDTPNTIREMDIPGLRIETRPPDDGSGKGEQGNGEND